MMTPLEIEKQLHQRLKIFGFILMAFALITLVWNFFPALEDEFEEIILEIEEAPPPLSPYLVSSTFAIVGGFCFFVHWKKKNLLNDTDAPEK